MAFQAYTRSILRSPSFPTCGSAPMIAERPSSAKTQSPGSLYYQPYPPIPWRVAKPYSETSERLSRNRQTEKPLRPPLPSSVFRAASAENRQHLDSWTPPSGNLIPVPGAAEDPQSSEISLCSSFGNIPDYAVSPGQDQRADINMHYGQPHAYALYDFDTKVEGDLQFRVGDILILEDVVDEAWYRGHSVRTGQVGIFPMNHVEVRIPLATGLYTKAQPKPRVRAASETKDSQKKLQMFQPRENVETSPNSYHLQTNGQSYPSNDFTSVPRRPSRVRVSSLRCKYDILDGPNDEAVHGQSRTSASASRSTALRRAQTQYQPLSSLCTTDTALAPSEPRNQTFTEKSQSSRVQQSFTPSIVTTTRPRSQTSVHQLAQNLEQRGITLNRMKSMPPGGRAVFPTSVSPKPCVSSIPVEQPDRLPDYKTPETTEKRVLHPNAYMVPTPLALIAREQNRILGKGKLAPTEAYPSTTSSDPQLDKSSKTEAKMRMPHVSENGGSQMVSTVSEINLSRKPTKWSNKYGEPVVPVAQPLGSNNLALPAYSNQQHSATNSERITYDKISNEVNPTTSRHANKPSTYDCTANQNPLMNCNMTEIPSALQSREDTLVHEDKSNHEEQQLAFDGDSVSRTETSKSVEAWRQSEIEPQYAPDMRQNTMRAYATDTEPTPTPTNTTATTTMANSESPTYVTKMTQDLSIDQPSSSSPTTQTVANHSVPELPDSANCLKTPTTPINLDRKQTDNFKEAIFSSLKRSKRPEQWLYVLYDYAATEPGDLSVQKGSVIRCLDPLPPPAHSNDVSIPERWMHCTTWYGQAGQVPSTFVRRILDPEELDGLLQCRPRAQALYDFNSEANDDLPLKAGDIMYLYEAVDANWYRGESASTGKQGIFPISFVRVIYPL